MPAYGFRLLPSPKTAPHNFIDPRSGFQATGRNRSVFPMVYIVADTLTDATRQIREWNHATRDLPRCLHAHEVAARLKLYGGFCLLDSGGEISAVSTPRQHLSRTVATVIDAGGTFGRREQEHIIHDVPAALPRDLEPNTIPPRLPTFMDSPDYGAACIDWHREHDDNNTGLAPLGQINFPTPHLSQWPARPRNNSPAYTAIVDALQDCRTDKAYATNPPLSAYSAIVDALETIRQSDRPADTADTADFPLESGIAPHANRQAARFANYPAFPYHHFTTY